MSDEHLTLATALSRLAVHIGKLSDGSEDVADFNTWFFMNSAWEDSDDEALMDLGTDIESILYQWQDFSDIVTVDEVISAIRSAVNSILKTHALSLSLSAELLGTASLAVARVNVTFIESAAATAIGSLSGKAKTLVGKQWSPLWSTRRQVPG